MIKLTPITFALTALMVCAAMLTKTSASASSASLPLIQIEQLQYQGGFIIPNSVYGESRADNVTGHMEYNPENNSLFFAGKFTEGAVAEFSIPTLVNSTDVALLNTGVVLQDFRRILDETSDTNPQNLICFDLSMYIA